MSNAYAFRIGMDIKIYIMQHFFVRGFHESLLHVYKFIIYVCKYCVGNITEYPTGYKE